MSFNPDNPRRKALIAMSGGVDSSVAAYLAIESGLDCIGVTMKLFNNEDAGISRERSCCSLEDTEYARGVAYRLGMPYYVLISPRISKSRSCAALSKPMSAARPRTLA